MVKGLNDLEIRGPVATIKTTILLRSDLRRLVVEHECEILADAFSTVIKVLLKELEVMKINGQMETIQTSTLLRTARILRRVLETWGDLLSLKLL